MNSIICATLRHHLGAFVDGELAGAEMLRVSEHLETCSRCAAEVADLKDTGSLLRAAAASEPLPPSLAGLAGGVVSRVRAESAQSWRRLFQTATEDWHWVIVGGGAVIATFVSMVFAGALLLFGPVPVREDSLSALINNLGSPAGRLLIEATTAADSKDPMLMEVQTGSTSGGGASDTRVLPAMLGFATERELVDLLTTALVPQSGRLVEFAKMPEVERKYAESLLDNLSRFRMGEPTYATVSALNVHRVRLVTNTGVSAKIME
jgi:hypothetical protein